MHGYSVWNLLVGVVVVETAESLPHEVWNLGTVGSREQHASIGTKQSQYVSHLLAETQFQTLVELVNDQCPNACGTQIFFSHMVEDASWRADNQLRLLCHQFSVLFHCRSPAVASDGADGCRHFFHHVAGLKCQFARRNEHQSLHLAGVRIQSPEQWQQISIDLEMLQTEGFGSVRRVDPLMVLKKQKGKEVEVQDGWVGRILPFDLVQAELLSDEASKVASLEERLSAISSELAEIVEGLTDEDKADAGDAVNEAGDALVASKLRGVIKGLKADLDASSSLEDSLPSRLECAASLFDEEGQGIESRPRGEDEGSNRGPR